MDGGDASMEKKMQSIFETVSDCSAWNTVDIQLSYDKWPFSSIREFTSSEWIDRQEIAIPNKEFTDIVLRVIITGNAKHHAVRMRYEIIEE